MRNHRSTRMAGAAAPVALLALVPLAQAQDAGAPDSFSLPPQPAPSPAPAAGPADSEKPAAQPAPAPSPPPAASGSARPAATATARPSASASARPSAKPSPRPSPSPSPAPSPAPSPKPSPTPSPTPSPSASPSPPASPAPVPAAPASSAPGRASNRPSQAADAAPLLKPRDSGQAPGWLVPAGAGAAALLGGAAVLARRRRRRDAPEAPVPAAEPAAAAPVPAAASPLPPPPRADATAGLPLVQFAPRELRLSLVYATVSYTLTVSAGMRGCGPLAISGDMITAHASLGSAAQLAPDPAELKALHALPGLAAGDSTELRGDLRLPLSALRVIDGGQIGLFVPLLRFHIAAEREGQPPAALVRVFALGMPGEAEGAPLVPFRLDLGPRAVRAPGFLEVEPGRWLPLDGQRAAG